MRVFPQILHSGTTRGSCFESFLKIFFPPETHMECSNKNTNQYAQYTNQCQYENRNTQTPAENQYRKTDPPKARNTKPASISSQIRSGSAGWFGAGIATGGRHEPLQHDGHARGGRGGGAHRKIMRSLTDSFRPPTFHSKHPSFPTTHCLSRLAVGMTPAMHRDQSLAPWGL